MSSYIPFEVQVEIIKRVVDVKPLLCFRTVSKIWKSFIDSSEFITHHHNINHTRHLIARYNVDNEYKYVSIADDDSFPRHKFYHVVPRTIGLVINNALMLDCSHGLVCFYGYNVGRKNMIVIWNPLIRKFVGVVMPAALTNGVGVGVGVCPKTLDPKIVKVTKDSKAEVFTLSTGVWRTIKLNLPLKSTRLDSKLGVVNGVIYWVAYDTRTGYSSNIILFYLTSEEFGEVALPNDLPAHSDRFIYNFKESLALANHYVATLALDVWMMIKDGDSKSLFAKLFSFAFDNLGVYHIVAFKMNGQSIMIQKTIYDEILRATLKVYDPSSKYMNDLEIGVDVVNHSFFKMTPYKESLLLLDQHATIFQ